MAVGTIPVVSLVPKFSEAISKRCLLSHALVLCARDVRRCRLRSALFILGVPRRPYLVSSRSQIPLVPKFPFGNALSLEISFLLLSYSQDHSRLCRPNLNVCRIRGQVSPSRAVVREVKLQEQLRSQMERGCLKTHL